MVFNKYGAMQDESTHKVDAQIFNLVRDHLKLLLLVGESLSEIRAVGHYFVSTVDGAVCEVVLQEAMRMRKAERKPGEIYVAPDFDAPMKLVDDEHPDR